MNPQNQEAESLGSVRMWPGGQEVTVGLAGNSHRGGEKRGVVGWKNVSLDGMGLLGFKKLQ